MFEWLESWANEMGTPMLTQLLKKLTELTSDVDRNKVAKLKAELAETGAKLLEKESDIDHLEQKLTYSKKTVAIVKN